MLSRLALGVAAASLAAAQPALRGTNLSRSLSDSQVYCQDSGHTDNINWCGDAIGDSGDWSCTPWGFKVDWTDECDQHDGHCWTTTECDAGDGSLIVGEDGSAATYLPKWQNPDGSWCDSVTCADQCGGANYYVFHTCDGAGLQSDCKGSQWYVEQLSQYNGERGTNGGDPQPGEVHPSGTTDPAFNFNHPGTGNDYEWYWCGWWSKVEDWAGYDASATRWMDNTNGGSEVSNSGSGHTPSWARDAFGGQDADATVALYPWICQNGADADKTGIQKGAAMDAGDHGDDVWNCFCDNNGPDGHPGDSQPPPHYKLYSIKKEGDGWLHVVGVAGDAINPGVSNDDFYLQAFDDAW